MSAESDLFRGFAARLRAEHQLTQLADIGLANGTLGEGAVKTGARAVVAVITTSDAATASFADAARRTSRGTCPA